MLRGVFARVSFGGARRAARRQPATQYGSQIFFGLYGGIKVLVAVACVPLSLLCIVLFTASAHEPDALAVSLIPFGLLAAILFSLPGTAMLDQLGIHKRFWWGNRRLVPWTDVASVVYRDTDGYILVYTKSGPTMSFSPYLVDQKRLQEEIRHYARVSEMEATPTEVREE
ncbi:MAG: hypothetical protein WAM91_09780 [Candidatus Acidiferrales bacterium]